MTSAVSVQLAEKLRGYLNAADWDFVEKGDCFHTGFSGEKKFYPLDIHFQATIVTFDCMLLKGRGDLSHVPSLFEFLHEMNVRSSMAKVVIDNNRLLMRIETFGEKMDVESFNLHLGVLGHYADMLLDLVLSVYEHEGCFCFDLQSIS